MTTARIISPVVYYGGKSMLAPWIVSHFPSHRVYVELFGGGASVLLAKERCPVEIYNDIWDEVVNFFRVARNRGQELKEKLRLTPYARAEFEAVITDPATDDPIERARRFLVVSRQAFGGCGVSERCLSSGNWKRPSIHPSRCSSNTWRNAIDGRMDALVDRLQGVGIENADFAACIEKFDSEQTLFYADPPYLMSGRSKKHQYRFDFTGEEHRRLADMLQRIKGKVIVSYQDAPGFDELYPGWYQVKKASHYRSQLYAHGPRKRITELLLINFNPAPEKSEG